MSFDTNSNRHRAGRVIPIEYLIESERPLSQRSFIFHYRAKWRTHHHAIWRTRKLGEWLIEN